MKSSARRPIEALELVALRIDANRAKGTPRQAAAEKLADEAVKEWKENLHHPKCPHCGKALR
jgi:hypothetical protein